MPKSERFCRKRLFSRLTLEKSASTVEVPGKTAAKPLANAYRDENRKPRRPQPLLNEAVASQASSDNRSVSST